jgi:hypothetical protein
MTAIEKLNISIALINELFPTIITFIRDNLNLMFQKILFF